ncbi:hypothetical protein EZV73_16120 [Acidaminobacter sp. JC074]|uniref:hypothetical protein n=1 Tax=Acidaminobacter sp. JC074 TaxID=2530199 RepID=UPI001F0D84B2|nr:hypothetical protein [Acidaminobacter sp. JC074]MCH4889122.1 hypothetical protein [Acidaminobacter sp. JC074]
MVEFIVMSVIEISVVIASLMISIKYFHKNKRHKRLWQSIRNKFAFIKPMVIWFISFFIIYMIVNLTTIVVFGEGLIKEIIENACMGILLSLIPDLKIYDKKES